jgi:hypothetical protein
MRIFSGDLKRENELFDQRFGDHACLRYHESSQGWKDGSPKNKFLALIRREILKMLFV